MAHEDLSVKRLSGLDEGRARLEIVKAGLFPRFVRDFREKLTAISLGPSVGPESRPAPDKRGRSRCTGAMLRLRQE